MKIFIIKLAGIKVYEWLMMIIFVVFFWIVGDYLFYYQRLKELENTKGHHYEYKGKTLHCLDCK